MSRSAAQLGTSAATGTAMASIVRYLLCIVIREGQACHFATFYSAAWRIVHVFECHPANHNSAIG